MAHPELEKWEIAFNPEALRREEVLETLQFLGAYVNFIYLKDSIFGYLEGASIAQVNLKLNEELVSNLFLRHYTHHQFLVGLLGARHCINYLTLFPCNTSVK